MFKNFGIKEVIAVGIGIAFFVAFTTIQIPLVFIPNTYLQPRMAIMAFFASLFGPVVGGIIGLIGHALGDAIFNESNMISFSWVIPDALVGASIGFFAKQYAVREGRFLQGANMLIFNGVQVSSNAIAWIGIAPALDMVLYKEPANRVFVQGAFAFLGNIVVISVLGTAMLIVYSKINSKISGFK